MPRLLSRLGLIFFVPIANAGYNLQSSDVTLTQDASDTTSPYNYTITFTINNLTGGRNQNEGIESMQLVLDDGSSYCFSGISIAPADVNTSDTYGPYNATAFTNNSSDASLPAGSYSSIQLGLFTDDNCGTQETFANNLAITITAPNSPPVAVDDTGAVDENSTLNVAASGLLGNDTDADADALSITAIRTGTEAGSGSAGTLSSSLTGTYGDLTLNADGSYSYNANNSESLSAGTTTTDTFTYTISDGAASDTGQLVITITGTNDAPVAVADAGAVNEDATLDVAASGVLGNDTDVDSNDTLAVSAIRTGSETGSGTSGSLGSALTGAYGDVTMNADGSYAYIANNAAALAAGAQVTDTFTYTVTDGNITDTAELVITITGTNDPPFATDDASAVDEDDTLSVAATGLLANDTDADAGASLSITAIRTGAESGSGTAGSIGVALAGAYGDFTVNADGSYSYNANNANALAAGTTATDTFTYTVSDGTITDTAEIVITVTGVNDPPEITGDLAITVDTDGTVYLTQTDLYYSDVDDSHEGGGVTFEITANPSKGSLETWSSAGGGTWTTFAAGTGTRWANRTALDPTGDPPTAFRYVHDSNNGVGDDSFTIKVEDGNEDNSTPSGSPYVETITVTVNPATGLDHYAVTLSSNSATTCGIIGVTLTAHDASHSAVVTDHSVTLGVSSAGPTWNDTGSATIAKTFSSATTVTANLRSSSVVSNVQITLTHNTDGNIGLDSGESPTFGFTGANSILTFTGPGNLTTGPGNLTAGLNNILPTARIVVTTPADCTAAGTGALNTDFYFTCLDPSSCINGQDLTINNQTVSSSSGSPTSVSLGFTSGTSALFEVNYEDVGQVRLTAAVTIAATGDNPAHTVTGSTTFVSKPADFILALDSNSASGGFKAAGEAFTIGTTATNLDGNPTPNFGAEATPETLTASFVRLVAPSGGANGSLSPGTYTHSGSGVGSLAGVTYSETGTINLQVGTDSDYLGTGSQINSSAVTTGRFYPSYFTLGSNQVIDSCSSGNFTYQGTDASVSYIVTAKNAADVTTSNYTNGASDLASFFLVAEATADDGSDYTTRLTQPEPASSNWNAGVYTLSNTAVAFSRSTTPEPSYSVDIGLKAIDTSDSVNFSSLDMNAAASGCGAACDAVDLSGNPNIRWGRLSLSSASGSEYQSLPLPLVTEYYNGSAFVTNAADSCTSIARTRIEFNDSPINTPSNLTIDIGSGTDNSTGSSINTDLTSADLVIVSGNGNLVFSAPNDNNRGSFTVDVDLSDLTHLAYDWDLDGSHDNSPPTATGTFGVFGGHQKVLFRKLAN